MDNRNLIKIGLVFMLILISTSSVLAFGISSPHSKKSPLKMYPGQTKEISFTLINTLGDEVDIDVLTDLLKGQEIAKIISGSNYNVPFGTSNTEIILEISIPKTEPIDTTKEIEFSVSKAPSGESGTVQLGIKYKVDFPIQIISQSEMPEEPQNQVKEPQDTPQKTKTNMTMVVISLVLIIALTIITTLVIIKKRKQV